jgi:hypothetical protein
LAQLGSAQAHFTLRPRQPTTPMFERAEHRPVLGGY